MNIVLRAATENDMQMLFLWTNDPEVRNNSFCTDPIPLSTHQNWFQKKLSSPDVAFYIMELDGVPVGQVRYELEDAIAITNYSIAKEYRGRGIGTKMIAAAEKKLLQEQPYVSEVHASVKKDNRASAAIFEKLCYLREEGASEYRFIKEFSHDRI